MEKNQTNKTVIISDYVLRNQLGKGSFGTVYQASINQISTIIKQEDNHNCQIINIPKQPIKLLDKRVNQKLIQNRDKNYAIKVETYGNMKPMLEIQYTIMKQLFDEYYQENTQKYRYPLIYEYGQYENYQYLVMEKLDECLSDKLKKFPQISYLTLINIMYQTLIPIQYLHRIGIIHRDIKPSNFMCKTNQIVLMDFGLSKKFIKGNVHIPKKQNKKMVGTPIFCSRNTHLGLQQSRRDDIESWFYTGLSLMKKLPWQIHLKQKSKDLQQQKISKQKINITSQQLLLNYPTIFLTLYNYISQLQFTQQPNYKYIYQLLQEYSKKNNGTVFDQINWQQQPNNKKTNLNIKINFNIKQKYFKQLVKVEIKQFQEEKIFEQIVNAKKLRN